MFDLRSIRNILLSLAVIPAWTLAADPVEFYAEYVAEYQGLPVRAKGIRQLTRIDDERFRLVSSAESIFAEIVESSEFTITSTGFKPFRYDYSRKGLGKNKYELNKFDWDTGVIVHQDTTSALEPGLLDKLTYQYKLQLDVAHAISIDEPDMPLVYEIADEEKRKLYRFRITGRELLQTPVGELDTVRVERMRSDAGRKTYFWLAVDYDFLLVRLKQVEEKKGFELNLSAATVDGIPL